MNAKINKITLIGAGQIGGTLALIAGIKRIGNIVLFDLNYDMAKAKALDIAQAAAIEEFPMQITAEKEYEKIKDSDVIIVTAGLPRKPNMSRDDLLAINLKIIDIIARNIAKYAPEAFVICITNPLDVMVWALQKISKLPKNKIVGMAGGLDEARFRYFIAQEVGVHVKDVSAIVFGGHGDTMIPAQEYVSIKGCKIDEFIKNGSISQKKFDEIVDRTRNGGAEIVGLLKTGSAFYAPASAAIDIAESYLQDKKKMITCAAAIQGQYQINDIYMGVPTIIGKNGVEKIIELEIKDKKQLQKTVNAINELIEKAKEVARENNINLS